ncbi:MAG: iron-containing alcohol dehydrogenase [Planctomycetota bacterium]|nr:MAG: iron-containing alcohol dehydrogenase [Planctomycetota bacterium]REK28976.1 MAG: iron-containing alcohol dehydrogenase [Planctomycetota bacterium]REK39590.1 MAG: iron-containing alcohol dehydrogenase [Planctomycetota bacterium]
MPDTLPPQFNVPAFDYDPRTRVMFGSGAVDRLGERARKLGGTRVLLVSDQGLVQAGHSERAESILTGEGLEVVRYDDVPANPTTDDIDRGAASARSKNIDLIIGLGGGSSMDCAKGINFILTSGGRMQDYRGIGKAKNPMLPLIAVPTTAGTGSEAQSFAVVADPQTHMKMACGDKKAAARLAILDPELTVTMPAAVTTATGIDALSHALETYVTTKRNPVSQLFSRQAWALLSAAFPVVQRNPNDEPARGAMLLGAHLAGAAIENSMLGATHALANPLTAHYGLTHGLAIGVMLSHVIRYNARAVPELYGHLAADAGLAEPGDPEAPLRLAEFVRRMVADAGAPTSLTACGVTQEMIPQLAAEAAEQWTGRFNPRSVQATEFEELYRCALTEKAL